MLGDRSLLYIVVCILAASLFLAGCGENANDDASESPRLIVAVVVDQMRPDFFDRYGSEFEHGLRRLIDEGYQFTNASHDHALTYTAAGHATLATGVFPSRSGIIANQWLEAPDWNETIYAVRDLTSPILGVPDLQGRSPANLLRTGLADWVQAASPDAKIVSLSRKDRAAITMAGKARGEVYWVAAPSFHFVTSTYYHDTYPEWINRVNEGIPSLLAASIWGDSVWESEAPDPVSMERADAAPFEGDGTHTTFPHHYADESEGAFGNWLVDTPFSDVVVVEAAIAALDELELGADTIPDYLSISLSSTDYVGHMYGPVSWEQRDNLLHLDRTLGRFLDALDDRVGEGNWILAFSSDHGVLTAPEHLVDMGNPNALRLASYRETRETAVAAAPDGDTGPEARSRVADAVETLEYVEDAYTTDELEAWPDDPEVEDPFRRLFRNSYHRDRRYGPVAGFGVILRLRENVLRTSDVATHGTPYQYDRRVPLIFLGTGVPSGWSDEDAFTVSFAPTLARVAGIPAPDDLDGSVLEAVVKSPQAN